MLTSEHYASPVDWAEDQFAKPLGIPGLLGIHVMQYGFLSTMYICVSLHPSNHHILVYISMHIQTDIHDHECWLHNCLGESRHHGSWGPSFVVHSSAGCLAWRQFGNLVLCGAKESAGIKPPQTCTA